MKSEEKYFIQPKGKDEFKTYHIIHARTFDMLEVFFDSESNAKEYAKKKGLQVISNYEQLAK